MLTWVFAAMNSVEPFVQTFVELDVFHKGEAWVEARRPTVRERLETRLSALSEHLGDKEYLEGRFTAGDLMMTTVLRMLEDSDVLARFASLDAYRRRCEARPAFGRAMEAQLKPFRETAPAT